MIDQIIGSNIATLRRQRGLSVADLARECSVSIEAIETFESGKFRPMPDELLKIAEAINVSLDQLYGGAKGMSPLNLDILMSDKG